MKTHLLTKKRALISSVAMLLVAIIALGTATFAWFTTNTSATADKLSVKTIKASELQVSDEQKNKGLLFIEKPFFPLNQALLDAALIKRLLIATRVGKVLSVGCGKIVGVGEVLLGAHIEVVVLGGTQDGFDGLL